MLLQDLDQFPMALCSLCRRGRYVLKTIALFERFLSERNGDFIMRYSHVTKCSRESEKEAPDCDFRRLYYKAVTVIQNVMGLFLEQNVG